MVDWNPSAQAVLGQEWAPNAQSSAPFGLSSAAGLRFTAGATEAVTGLRALLAGLTGTGPVIAEVYDGTPPGAIGSRTVTTLLPIADGTRVGWTTNTGATVNLYATVDEPVTAANDTDAIRDPGSSTSDAIRFRLGPTAAPATAGRRIAGVKARLRQIGGSVRVGWERGGTVYGATLTGYRNPGLGFATREVDFGEVCPWTGQAWTPADIAEMGDGTSTLYIGRGDGSGGWFVPQVSAIDVQVVHYAETRIASAVLAAPGTVADFPLAWAKVSGTAYTILVRSARAPGSTRAGGLGHVSGAAAPTGATLTARGFAVDGDGIIAATTTRANVLPAYGLNVGGGFSADSQPYGFLAAANVSTGVNRQEFTVGVLNTTYGVIRALVKVPPGGSLTRLRMEVRRSSDNALMGTAVEVTREQALAGVDAGNGWRLIQAQMATAAPLLGSTNYRLVFTVAGGTDAWQVAYLANIIGVDAGTSPGTGEVAGDTSPGLSTAADYVASLATTPVGLVSTSATVLHHHLSTPHAPTLDACDAATVSAPYARVTWAPTSLGGAFLAYEVQRCDDRDPEWRTIARLTDATQTDIYDHEVRMGGVATRYRARQVRTDGIGGDWTQAPPIVVDSPPGTAGGLIFSSSLDPEQTIAAPDVYDRTPARDYEYLDAEDLTLRKVYGRDGIVGFRGTEARGVTFGRTLLVEALCGARRGLTAFARLRALTLDPDLPYVCVRDSFGDRFFAIVNVTQATVTQPFDGHTAEVTVTEATYTPHVLTVGNGTLGPPWMTLGPARWATSGLGTARVRGAVAGTPSLAVVDTGRADGGARVEHYGSGAANNTSGVAIRVVDAQNFLALWRIPGFGTWQAVKVVGGTVTALGSGLGGSEGTSLEVRVRGDSIMGATFYAYENGVLRGSWPISEPIFDGATKAGLIYGSSTAAPDGLWDNFTHFALTTNLAGDWTVHGGLWRAEDSTARMYARDVIDNVHLQAATVNAGSADAQVHVVADWQDFGGLVIRRVDAENHIFIQASRTFAGWTVISRVAGVDTTLATASATASDNVDVVVQVHENRLRLRVNGAWLDLGGSQTLTIPAPAMAAHGTSPHHGIAQRNPIGAGRPTTVFRAFQVDPVTNIGVSGAALTTGPDLAGGGAGKWVTVLRHLTTPVATTTAAARRLFLAVWGINDAILGFGPGMAAAWRHSVRSVASWVLRVNQQENDDPSVTYSPVPGPPPLFMWSADAYTPGVGGSPGVYPNLGTGGALDLAEPAAVAERPVRLPYAGEKYAYLPGNNPNRPETTTADGLDVAGDIDMRVDVHPDTWRPSAQGALLSRFAGSPGPTTAWRLALGTTGALVLTWREPGATDFRSASSTVPIPADAGRLEVRAAMDADNGSGGATVTFWTRPPTAGASWEQLGAPVVSPGPTSIVPSPTILTVGSSYSTGSTGLPGRYYSAEVRDGIDGPAVASWAAADMDQAGGTSGGRAWKINRVAGGAAKAVLVDRTVALLDGVDDRLATAHDPRLDWQAGGMTVVHVMRQFTPATAGVILAKKATQGTSAPGWFLRHGLSNPDQVVALLSNGTANTTVVALPGATVLPAGLRTVVFRGAPGGTGRLDVGALSASTPFGAVNPSPEGLTIGTTATPTAPTAMEWVATMVFDRVLDDAEVAALTAVAPSTVGWNTYPMTDVNTGTSATVASHPGATALIAIPGSYTGGPIALRFIGGGPAGGGTPTGSVSVYVDGAAAPVAVVDTNVWTSTGPYVAPVTVRIPSLAPGAHTIRAVADTTVGPVTFDGWHVEQDDPQQAPAVVFANVARITQSPQFHDADIFGAYTIGDTRAEWVADSLVGRTVTIYSGTGSGQSRTVVANTADTLTVSLPWLPEPDATSDFIVQAAGPWGGITHDRVAAYNAALAETVAEFGGLVKVLDIDAVLAADPHRFNGDGLHPSSAGAEAIAAALVDLVGGVRRSWLTVAGHSYSVGTGAGANRGIDDAARRALVSPFTADSFTRRDDGGLWLDTFDRT